MKSLSIGFKFLIGSLLEKRIHKTKRVSLEQTLEGVERVNNYVDSNFILMKLFYETLCIIKLDPVLTYLTDERN